VTGWSRSIRGTAGVRRFVGHLLAPMSGTIMRERQGGDTAKGGALLILEMKWA
jgi:hypothetical protein